MDDVELLKRFDMLGESPVRETLLRKVDLYLRQICNSDLRAGRADPLRERIFRPSTR